MLEPHPPHHLSAPRFRAQCPQPHQTYNSLTAHPHANSPVRTLRCDTPLSRRQPAQTVSFPPGNDTSIGNSQEANPAGTAACEHPRKAAERSSKGGRKGIGDQHEEL